MPRSFVKLNPLATQTPIPIEEYLRAVYEPDAEFVDGEIVERHLGENPHSAAQVRLIQLFTPLSQDHDLHLRTELRMRLSPDRIRIPDFAVFREKPSELVPSVPPFVIVEIVSREDRHTEIVEKFEEYRAWGVPHIGLADPWRRQLSVYGPEGLSAVKSLRIPELDLEISPADIFE